MLKAHFEGNEIITSGEVEVDDNYHGFCCAGFDWEICIIIPDTEKRYNGIWGVCRNPDCPNVTEGFEPEEDYYRGVQDFVLEDFEEQLALKEI